MSPVDFGTRLRLEETKRKEKFPIEGVATSRSLPKSSFSWFVNEKWRTRGEDNYQPTRS